MFDSLWFWFINNYLVRTGFLLVLGLCIGSFLNVVIYRLPIMLKKKWRNECIEILDEECSLSLDNDGAFNLLKPDSHCPNCQRDIPIWANIPVISYFLLRGKCRFCNEKISIRYPLVELLTSGLFVAVGLVFTDGALIVAGLFFVAIIICLVFIDLDTFLLPDELTLPLLWLGLLVNLNGMIAPNLSSAVIGAAFGYLILWSIYWIFKLITKKEGMGYGDFKLLAALGAWFGWQSLVNILLVSSMLGIIYAFVLRFSGRLSKGDPVSFGPFLGIAGVITLFFMDRMIALLAH